MRTIKLFSLVCFSIVLIFGCAVSAPQNIPAVVEEKALVVQNKFKNLPEARDQFKFQSVIKRVKESVVLLSVSSSENPLINPKNNALCTGVTVSGDGHVITNFHCIVNQQYTRLWYFSKNDWQEYEVEILGIDPLADLALLQVIGKEGPVPYLKFADPKEIEDGLEVFAVGHPMGMVWTISKGIVSSTNRYSRHPYIKSVQTDAAINKGNSGGPLMNMRGEIVAINALIISRISENAGIALGIRGDIVQESYKTMLEHGKVDRPAIGVMISPLNNTLNRSKVLKDFPELKSQYVPNTFGLMIRPDEKLPKGIKPWDTLVGVNGQPVNDGVDLANVMIKSNIGDIVTLTIIRKRRYMNVDIPLLVFPIPIEKMYPMKPKTPTINPK